MKLQAVDINKKQHSLDITPSGENEIRIIIPGGQTLWVSRERMIIAMGIRGIGCSGGDKEDNTTVEYVP